MTPEERLLQTITKLQSQVYEDQEEIKQLCITAIKEYGSMKNSEGHMEAHLPDGMWHMD